ncbi:UbiD family decarboxylase [Chloroflexota bacterium]
MAYYRDIREHIEALEAKNRLVRIKREINKDTELMPLVRWQFRGLPEEERKAFLFENVVDATGKKYNIPVLVASYAASRDVYAISLMCKPEEIVEKLAQAQRQTVEPRVIDDGPVHEEIHIGENLLEHDGLSEFPVPISTPGFDNAPYISAGNWVTKDPETGIRNVGIYRGMIKSKTRAGIMNHPGQHLRIHWEKCRQMGKSLQAAIVMGAIPAIGLTSAMKLPYGIDEFAVGGGIAGMPIELVKCKTVDIEVPATAEIVIEGELPTDSMEREGPFGEYTGFMAPAEIGPYFNITCITHRKNPIYHAFISQFPPSESSKLRHIAGEAYIYNFLRHECGLPVVDVSLHETSGAAPYCVVSLKKTHLNQGWQALYGVLACSSIGHKIITVVDDDIDVRDADSVNWAISWRVQPNRDTRVVPGIISQLDPSLVPPTDPRTNYPVPSGSSAMLINATRKWGYPTVSLPQQQFMERARQIWEEEGLPALKPKKPWYGYPLDYWTKEYEDEAELALKGQHFQTGEKLANLRVDL